MAEALVRLYVPLPAVYIAGKTMEIHGDPCYLEETWFHVVQECSPYCGKSSSDTFFAGELKGSL